MSDLTKIHQELKKILLEFHQMCSKNDINYSLSGGTMLGAIRDKGFIPWDDDADILMERKEYDKLIKNLDEKFDIINILWVPRIVYKGTKELEGGNSIDILVYDNAPDSRFSDFIKTFKLKFLQGTLKENIDWSSYNIKGKLLIFIPYFIGKFLSKKQKLDLYTNIAKSDNDKSTKNYASFNNEYRFLSMRFDKKLFSSYTLVPFEDIELSVISGYHEYLTIAYGDYMKKPPVEEQVPKHGRI